MNNTKQISVAALALCMSVPLTSLAVVAPDASVVQVKKNCGSEDNCFDNMTALSDWVHSVRLPSSANTLLVDVGPGDFSGYHCTNSGYTTIRGSGRGTTNLTQGAGTAAVNVTNCTKLGFQDITISGSGNNAIGIEWAGAGNSTYSNVELTADGGFVTAAWYDHGLNNSTCDSAEEKSEHFFYGSTITSKGTFYNNSYYTFCAVSWFYGSELIAVGGDSTYMLTNSPFRVQGNGVEVQLFGSRVTSLSGDADVVYNFIYPGQGLVGAHVSEGARFHMHGGIISVKAQNTTEDTNVAGIVVGGANSHVHVIDTAFNPSASGGATAHRILNVDNAKVSSPFLWFSGTTPPSGNANGDSIQSETGEDMFVETDCNANGDCNNAGTETHIMIYNAACSTNAGGDGSSWYNSTVARCRGDVSL